MIRRPFVFVLTGCLALLPSVAGRPRPARAEGPQAPPGVAAEAQVPGGPMPVLSDTTDYCTDLEHRIASYPNRPADVRQLQREGQQMCDHGQVRGGLHLLRQALMQLKHPKSGPKP